MPSEIIFYASVSGYALLGLLIGAAYGRSKESRSASDYWIGWACFWPALLCYLAWDSFKRD